MGVNEIVLGLTLGIAVFTDWREHRIYNKLLFPAFLLALLLQTVQGGIFGLVNSLFGAAVGFALLLIPYFLGGMGAGDVKLLTVIGAFGGAQFVLISFLYGSIVGGLISLYLLVRCKQLDNTLKHLLLFFPIFKNQRQDYGFTDNMRQAKFPYGIAIALGTLIALFLPQLGG